MNTKIENYGVKAVKRPPIKASKTFTLHRKDGELIVRKETKAVLKKHKNTFTKLSKM